MMNRAVATPQAHQPGAIEQVSYLTSLERTQPTMSQIPATAQPRIEVIYIYTYINHHVVIATLEVYHFDDG